MKINRRSKEGIKKKIASFSLVALLLSTAMVGLFVPSENVLRACGPTYDDAAAICAAHEAEGKTVVMFPKKKLTANCQPQSASVSADILAGIYGVTLVSYDGYCGRRNSNQSQEQWYAALNNGNGEVAQTGTIGDLNDCVDYVIKEEIVNTGLIVSEDVASVVAHHAGDPAGGGNSVYPVCAIFDLIPPELEEVTIVVSKIICDDESDLPNWGGDPSGTKVPGEPNIIGLNTAQDYVNDSNGKCRLAEGWSFQVGDKTAVKKAGDFYGEASVAENWTTFGLTGANGTVETVVDISNIASPQLRLREVLQEGYIPFTYPPNDDNVSAEFYCANDIHNYDNYDYINNPVAGETYYCVAFNTLIEECPYCEMELTKTDNQDPVQPGDELIYHLILTNTGTGNCTGGGVLLKDVFDADTSYVIANPLPNTIDNDYLEWNFGILEPGETEEIDLTMLVSQNVACDSVLINKTKYFSDQTDWGNFVEEETLVVCEEPPVYQCSDDLDNDGDDLIDEEDPGCHSDGNPDNPDSYVPTDDDEYNGPVNEGDVVINELMWMGSAGSIVDEWIELRNMTDSPVNLSGCCLNRLNGSVEELMLNIPSGDSISANGYYLISNYSADSSNIDIIPDLVDTDVSLSNSELQIKLYCGQTLIDTAGDGGDPLNMAGDKVDPKKSMSRKVTLGNGALADSWCTAVTQENWDDDALEFGTPGAPNVCNLISGYKFNDLNNNGTWDDGEPGIDEWTIELYQNLLENPINTAITIAGNLGYYEFKNLIAGTYFVKEEIKSGWRQTFPTISPFYEIVLSDNEISEDNNFGNYQELEIKASIFGCKYNDENSNSVIDEGEKKLSGWDIQLIGCPYAPLEEGALEFLPKSSINTDPDPGMAGYCSVTATTVTGEDGCYSFTDLEAGDYGVSEVTQENWTQTFPVDNTFYYFSLTDGEAKTEIDFLNYEEPTPVYQCSDGDDNDQDGLIDDQDPGCWTDPENSETYDPEDNDEYHAYCGDGVCNNNETCSTCPQDCGSCGGGGGTVITKPSITITNENVVYLGGGEALVTWTTNIETTRQVAYGDDSIDTEDLGDAPEYGYDSVNKESMDMTKEHSVTISGLIDGVIYYFRPVADRFGSTGEVVGDEVFYELGEVKGIEAPTPTPIPIPAPTECNYLLEYIKLGVENNPVEVMKLETFLNEFEGENLTVNGIYEQVDFDAVSRFQEKYFDQVLSPWSHDKATGFVYITTKKKINELYCEREFPLTPEQEAEVARFRAMFGVSIPVVEMPPADDVPAGVPSEEPGEELDEKPGEVAGAKDEAEAEEELQEEPEDEEKAGELADDGTLLIGGEDEDETEEDGSIIKMFRDFGNWAWLIVIIIIGAIAYAFSLIAKRKKRKEQ